VEENTFLILFAGSGNFRIRITSSKCNSRKFQNSARKRLLLRHGLFILLSYFGYFVKLIFSRNFIPLHPVPPFRSVPYRALELTLLGTSECLGMCTFFACRIMETLPSLFRVIFLIEIPFPTLAT